MEEQTEQKICSTATKPAINIYIWANNRTSRRLEPDGM
jgi:hypothetical protein